MDQLSGLNISNGILREYTGQASDIIIPEKVKGISSAVFKDYHALRSIMLPAGLEEIDSRCFEGCTGLKTVMFPASLSRIGKYAFAGCSSLVFFRMPADLTFIGSYAFRDCISLSSIELPEGVEEIGVGAFMGCSGLRTIRITGRHTTIKSAFGTHPFVGCDKLKIYTPSGSEAERFGLDNGIPVINIHAAQKDTMPEIEKSAKTSHVSSGAGEKAAFTFADTHPAASSPAPSAVAIPAAVAEKHDTEPEDHDAEKNQQIYDEAVSLYNSGTESGMQKAIEMMRSIGSFSDARHKAREFAKDLKRQQKESARSLKKQQKESARSLKEQQKESARNLKMKQKESAGSLKEQQKESRKEEAEKERLARKKAAGQEKAAKPGRSVSLKAAVIVLALVLAAGAGAAGIYYAKTHPLSSGDSKTSKTSNTSNTTDDYTLTLEDYINSNDAAKEQLIQSVEDTDVIISVSKNTLIYTYDLSSSNSVTPELAQSEELKESLGETLDSSDEKFTELCTGLEKDTGISGVSVEVIFRYGDEELLTRTYTSEGRQ